MKLKFLFLSYLAIYNSQQLKSTYYTDEHWTKTAEENLEISISYKDDDISKWLKKCKSSMHPGICLFWNGANDKIYKERLAQLEFDLNSLKAKKDVQSNRSNIDIDCAMRDLNLELEWAKSRPYNTGK